MQGHTHRTTRRHEILILSYNDYDSLLAAANVRACARRYTPLMRLSDSHQCSTHHRRLAGSQTLDDVELRFFVKEVTGDSVDDDRRGFPTAETVLMSIERFMTP